jgi:hypothetical protein
MWHVTFIFTLPHDPKKLYGKIVFNYLDNYENKSLDKQIKMEIFEATRKSINSIGILSFFEVQDADISEDEKIAFDLYINCIKDYYYPII